MTRIATLSVLAVALLATAAPIDVASAARGGGSGMKAWTSNTQGPANAPSSTSGSAVKTWTSNTQGPANGSSSTSGAVVRDHGTKPVVRDHRGQKYVCINGKCGWVTPHK